jgi:hypothetical protein
MALGPCSFGGGVAMCGIPGRCLTAGTFVRAGHSGGEASRWGRPSELADRAHPLRASTEGPGHGRLPQILLPPEGMPPPPPAGQPHLLGDPTVADSGVYASNDPLPSFPMRHAWGRTEWEVVCHQVGQAYLEHLLKEGRFEEAANLCPRLLKVGNGTASLIPQPSLKGGGGQIHTLASTFGVASINLLLP